MAKKASLKDTFGKKAMAAKEGVVDAEIVKEEEVQEPAAEETKALAKGKTREEIFKPRKPGELSLMEQAKNANPDFELGSITTGNRIQLDGGEFILRSADDDEPVTVDEFDCVLVAARTATSWYDKPNNMLYISYDGNTVQDGTSTEVIAEKLGVKGSFRVEISVGLEGFEEVFIFLTSGTAFYRLREYAAFLVDATKPKGGEKKSYELREVVTKVTSEKLNTGKGTFYAPKFEFVREL